MVSRFVYPNGLRLLAVPMASTETVTVLVLVGTGSRYETRELNGISHFLEHLMFKGTTKRPGALDISEELDSIGAEYNAFTSKEYTGYYIKCAAQKLDIALDLISDIFQNSKFDEQEIEREKGPVKEEVNMWFDNPARYVGTLYDQLLFGDQPLGWDIAGTKEHIDSFQRADLVGYFGSHYTARNTIIAIAGNIEDANLPAGRQGVKIKVQSYFNNIREQEKIHPVPVIEHQIAPALKLFHKKVEQVNVNFGFRALSRFHPDYEALEVMSAVLGGGMSSRLFVEVREKRGWAYRIGCGATAYHETGDFTTAAGLSTDKLIPALEIIVAEHKRLLEEPVSARELTKIKDYIKGKFAIGLELSDAQASFYGEQELLEEKVMTPEEKLAKIDAVTSENIQAVAKEIFRPERLNLAVIGPDTVKEDDLRKIIELW